MPIYLYACICGYEAEVAHSITEDPLLRCDECHEPMFRKPQSTNIEFKGSGWGKDD